MNDYLATLKIQQGRIKSLMRDLGIKSVSELSRRSGVSLNAIYEYVNFKNSPRRPDGSWRANIIPLCKALAAEPNDVFPDHLNHEIATNCIQQFSDAAQLTGSSKPQLLPPDEMGEIERDAILDEVLSTLGERERYILRGRFYEGMTCEEVGRKYMVTPERIRQIETRALLNMRKNSLINERAK
jgi:RNA polymerase sigma factor (sigma-70 family)